MAVTLASIRSMLAGGLPFVRFDSLGISIYDIHGTLDHHWGSLLPARVLLAKLLPSGYS